MIELSVGRMHIEQANEQQPCHASAHVSKPQEISHLHNSGKMSFHPSLGLLVQHGSDVEWELNEIGWDSGVRGTEVPEYLISLESPNHNDDDGYLRYWHVDDGAK